jgi:hypothetical protein
MTTVGEIGWAGWVAITLGLAFTGFGVGLAVVGVVRARRAGGLDAPGADLDPYDYGTGWSSPGPRG